MDEIWNPLAVSEGISFGGGRAVVSRHGIELDRFKLTVTQGPYIKELELSRAELALLIHVCNDALELTK